MVKYSDNLEYLTDVDAARQNLGLGNVDNTSDEEKPCSRQLQELWRRKLRRFIGMSSMRLTGFLRSPGRSVEDKPETFGECPYASLG